MLSTSLIMAILMQALSKTFLLDLGVLLIH